MSTTPRTITLRPGANMNSVINVAAQRLTAQGYEVRVQIVNPTMANFTVLKDRNGIKDIAGLGIECRCVMTMISPTQLYVTFTNEWTNKIIAFVVGWFLFWIPFVTALIGAIEQEKMPETITSALMLSAAPQQYWADPGCNQQYNPYQQQPNNNQQGNPYQQQPNNNQQGNPYQQQPNNNQQGNPYQQPPYNNQQ